MTKRTFPNPLLAALLMALLSTTAFASVTITFTSDGTPASQTLEAATPGDTDPDDFMLTPAQIASLTVPTKPCATFATWQKSGTDIDPDEEYSIAATYTATWTPTCVVITFTSDGTPASQTLEAGTPGDTDPDDFMLTPAQIASLTVPTKPCATFATWQKSGTDIDPDEEYSIAATYTATWTTPVGYTCYVIKFMGMGGTFGTGANAPTTTNVGTKENGTVTALPANPRRNGYTFKEWNLLDGTKVIATTVFAAATDVYAIWTQNATPVITPAANSFSIVVSSQSLQIVGASKAMPVSIYNLKGKLVLNSTAMPNESISLAHLPKGVYIVRAGSKTAKFAR